MREGWKTVPMGQLCSISSGKSDTKDAVENGPYAFFDRSRAVKKSSRFLYDCDALIIPGEGTEFLPKHFIGKFDLHQRAYALFDFVPQIDVKYLYYFLHYLKDYFPRVAVGATVKSLRRRHFEQLPVALTNISEQKRIVAILDEVFEGIATAVANAEKNRANARELFEGYLDSALARKDEGWIERPLGECFRLKSGDGLTSKAMVDGPFPVFGGNGIAGMHSEFNLSGDNVIVGRVGALCGNARFVTDKIWLTDNAFRVVGYSREFDGSFLTFLLNRLNLRSLARQSAQPVISNSSLKDLLLVFPISVTEQRQIAVNIETVFAETRRLEVACQQKLSNFVELKQAILQKAFAGELSAPSAHAVQEAAE